MTRDDEQKLEQVKEILRRLSEGPAADEQTSAGKPGQGRQAGPGDVTNDETATPFSWPKKRLDLLAPPPQVDAGDATPKVRSAQQAVQTFSQSDEYEAAQLMTAPQYSNAHNVVDPALANSHGTRVSGSAHNAQSSARLGVGTIVLATLMSAVVSAAISYAVVQETRWTTLRGRLTNAISIDAKSPPAALAHGQIGAADLRVSDAKLAPARERGVPVAAAGATATPNFERLLVSKRAELETPSENKAPTTAPTTQEESLATAQRHLASAKKMWAAKEIEAARLLLHRALELGNAEAALLLGKSYDKIELEAQGNNSFVPDSEKAERWYKRALTMGLTEANEALARLGRHSLQQPRSAP